MILEAAMLQVRPEMEERFDEAFRDASSIIASMPGYHSHALRRCLEVPATYLLLVLWERLEDHTTGFRTSPAYQEWKRSLHHFYDSFPIVEHIEPIHAAPLPQ